jgi:hypothetical protein
MPYDKSNRYQMDIARWVNARIIKTVPDFNNYKKFNKQPIITSQASLF